MTRWSGATTLLGGAILAAAFLSACGADDDGATAAPSGCPTSNASVALAVGARSNVPQAQFPPVTLPSLRNAADHGKAISIIRIDGKPKVLSLPAFTTDAGNDRARGQALDTYIGKYVGPALAGPGDNSVHAQAAEVNVLSALDLAAASVEKGGRIIMVDSGLQTTGPLDFRNPGQFSAEPSQVVDFLKQQGLLPDLTGKNVLLSGFGYTASPQAQLNQKWRDNVISQWTAIVQAGGGCVEVDRRPNTAGVLANKPPVTPVTPPATVSFAGCGDTALTDAERVAFVTGTDKFTDPTGARTTLGRLAVKLKNGNQHVTLIGSTSSEGGDEINNPLSEKRADRVRAELVSLGISPDRITVKGVGAHLEGRADDRAADGSLLPGPAALNRKVVVRLPKCTP